MDTSQIGKRAWSYAGVLMSAGLSNVEYVEQLTMLLFLKMADQLTEAPYHREPVVPAELGWKTLLKLDGPALEAQYQKVLDGLGVRPGMLGVIFKDARNDIRNPALLKQLIVNLIDKDDWASRRARGSTSRRGPSSRPSVLARGHEPDRYGLAAAAGRARNRDRRRFGHGSGAVHEDRGTLE